MNKQAIDEKFHNEILAAHWGARQLPMAVKTHKTKMVNLFRMRARTNKKASA